jgi:RNA polymerase sigma-70 factor (ECF subfamily)
MMPHPPAVPYEQALADVTARLLGGQSQALGDILRLLGARTERVIRGRLGRALSEADYEDVISIALFRLWQRRDRFDPSRSTLDQWFYVLARNAALDLVRRHRRQREDPAGDDLDRLPAPVAAAGPAPASELRRDLWRALENVSDVDRRILLSGLTENELSRELGIKPGTIRVRRLRTKEKLRSVLKDLGHVVRE